MAKKNKADEYPQEQSGVENPTIAPEAPPSSAEAVPETAWQDSEASPRGDFPIVGIGASAGGLAAFEAFFSGLPADTDPGLAFVIVQHLAPDHKSILTDFVRHYTRLQVLQVEDGIAVRPNCVYVIAPGRGMAATLHEGEGGAAQGSREDVQAGRPNPKEKTP